MKTYVVTASYKMFCTVEVEAVNEDAAIELASELDGGDFVGDFNLCQSSDTWQIEEANEKGRI